MVTTDSPRLRDSFSVLGFGKGAPVTENQRREGGSVSKLGFSILTVTTSTTDVDSFFSLSGTFLWSWFSNTSSEEGELSKGRSPRFPADFHSFRQRLVSIQVSKLVHLSSYTPLYN